MTLGQRDNFVNGWKAHFEGRTEQRNLENMKTEFYGYNRLKLKSTEESGNRQRSG